MLTANNLGTLLVLSLIGHSALPTLASGQAPDRLRTIAEDSVTGCYELTPGTGPNTKWFRSIEKRIWLTMDELTGDSGIASPVFVVRPAPQERAASYHTVRWTLVESGTKVSVSWETGLVFVWVIFPVITTDKGRADGVARHHSDTLGPLDSIQIRVQRSDC